jgi:Asp-tRNA(Asn)/Glu-tRNA(Gln) amidotransferase A subunit family amidase
LSDDLAFAGALEQAALVRAGEISSQELVDLYLDRIERIDPQLNAYVTVVDRPEAPRDGPFHGVPIPIKDLNEAAGIRTTFSCKAYADYVSQSDAAVVRRIRDAGFVVIGKTNTPEFGSVGVTESELNGDCRNPWDTSRTPGGSSGGAAAAVAAGLAPVAHASDGGGSIRIPASCCNLFGIKPSRGRVSPAPFGSGSLGLGTSGPLARTVRDAAALLDVMTGMEAGDFFVAPPPAQPYLAECSVTPGRLRVAVTSTPPIDAVVDRECVAAVEAAAELLAELGHDVVEATPPWRSGDATDHFIRIWQIGPATAGVEDISLLEPLNRAMAERARATASVDAALSVMRLQAMTRRIVAFWDDVDVVLTPTLALPPVEIGWTWADDPWETMERQWRWTPFTAIVNVTGQPAASVPMHWSAGGLPIGVHLIGKPFDEATLFRLAAQIEEARPWANARPNLA